MQCMQGYVQTWYDIMMEPKVKFPPYGYNYGLGYVPVLRVLKKGSQSHRPLSKVVQL